LKNVMEEVVSALYQELLPGTRDQHDCPLCREDVMVYALNRLPPHYVTTRKGEVLSNVDLQAGQSRTDVTVAIMEGFRFVAANPRCDRARG
jgi:competence protein ComFB